MNPNYNQTITVYRRTPAKDTPDHKEKWERTVIRNCFFKMKTIMNYSTQPIHINTYIARVPACAVGLGWICREGDIVVKGECTEQGSEAILQTHKPNAFKVVTSADNTAWIDPHYRLEG